MLKYKDTAVVFEEIPDCVTLAINITNCPFHCKGCHSPNLRMDIGDELTKFTMDELLKNNSGVNCVLFLGDGNDVDSLCDMSLYVKNTHPELKTAIYSGYEDVLDAYKCVFDYIKTGGYDESKGPLNSQTTNQRLYKNNNGFLEDITRLFWRKIGGLL
jgi:anaerobic ribonucleoside-triphosphate reductase activating protein